MAGKVDFVMKPKKLVQLISNTLEELADQIEIAMIFGSLATNNFLIHSDVDLLIISDTLQIADIRSLLDPKLTDNGIYYDLLLLSTTEFDKRSNSAIIKEALGGIRLWE